MANKGGRPRNWRRALLRLLQAHEQEIIEALLRKARLGDPLAAQTCITLLGQLDKQDTAACTRCNGCTCRPAEAPLTQS
jgi:hypothetical protein